MPLLKKLRQYHAFWCPGSCCYHAINSHHIDFVKWRCPCLIFYQQPVNISVSRNAIKCKWIYKFPPKISAFKGLRYRGLTCHPSSGHGHLKFHYSNPIKADLLWCYLITTLCDTGQNGCQGGLFLFICNRVILFIGNCFDKQSLTIFHRSALRNLISRGSLGIRYIRNGNR